MTRRRFLGSLAAAGVVGVAACSAEEAGAPDGTPPPGSGAGTAGTVVPLDDAWRAEPSPAFALGVASGDPFPDGVVLWTRLLPVRLAPVADRVEVAWAVAADEAFTEAVATGSVQADAATGHAVHVDVAGLDPATTYWYRFRVDDRCSPIGRTRTAPAVDAHPAEVRFGVASCQGYQSGYFTAYRALTDVDLDAVIFLGDFIYELESSVAVRPHGMLVPSTVEEYRAFYDLNLRDPDLQAARAAHPWIVTWDDHEVEDNYAAGLPGKFGEAQGETPETFAAKRAAAYQAWWEHMPVRFDPPEDGRLDIYRALRFGSLVDLAVVDDRQYRTPPPEAGTANLPRQFGGGPRPPEAFAEEASLLGADQEAWLVDRLTTDDARWQVLAQQSIMAPVNRLPDQPGGGYSMDTWDGYVAARRRLLEAIDAAGVTDVVSVGGDLHTSVVADVHLDPEDPTSPIVVSELVGPSVSALETLPDGPAAGARANPHVHLYDTEHRGVLVVTFTEAVARATFVYVDATVPDAEPEPGSTWTIEAGTPGAQEAT